MEAISVGLSHLTLTTQKWSILSHPVFGDPSVINWEKQALPEGNSLQLSPYGISCPLEISNFCTDWISDKAVSLDHIPIFWTGKVGQNKSHNFGLWSAHLISPLFSGGNIEFIELFMINHLFQFLACSWGSSPSAPQLINILLELGFRMGPSTSTGVVLMPILVVI